ncbi:MAG: SoxR reducing system RseC family protein [Clostridia bacterium]|nr:SoxR reducing system RseC family protein [Clostridia bacterium]
MLKKGIVVAADANMATIEELRTSYCFECISSGHSNNCLVCKKREPHTSERHISVNSVDAQVGDVVEYTKNRFVNVLLSLITIFLPLVLMVVSYIALKLITADDQLSGRISLGVLALSMIGMALCSYKLSKIRCDYKIISKV